jgi:DNA-binding MarR family transcriptional regulator
MGSLRRHRRPLLTRTLDDIRYNTYIARMATGIREEIKQARPFTSVEQEAHVSLGRTWALLEHAFSELLRPYGITPTQYNVLRILRGSEEKGLCRYEVTERMIAKVPDATRLLDRMEAAGLIARERGTVDRRFVTTRITEEGLCLLAKLEDPVQDLHRKHFGTLEDSDLRRLIETLACIRQTL